MITQANRVPVSYVRDRQNAGGVQLVCAYDDEEKCRSLRLPGSITLRELNDRLPSLSQDRELVFYCA